ncbi:HNH endonuclease [Streptomyces sp. SDr-06]|uniref:HNH endonuclease n=1 Tax=Streptomyces sp. SDr-06 TaxID=2267702 RepID=UPI000DE90CFA|nr:HNH endonuclease [Streptomyces sp. SDr-06]RCH68735.1 HNH endonuclease [Streptomyces sp. SDr-06]
MKICRLCGRAKPAEQFLAGKAKKPSSACATCRRKKQQQHIKGYYRSLSPDERHRLTHKRRAEAYGVVHEAYSRTAIFTRWGYACAYCGAHATHLDHVRPLSRGGVDAERNIVPACQRCNLSKGAKTLAEWALTFKRDETPGNGYPF